MKKALSFFALLFMFGLMSNTASAQKYFVYDGKAFNVMFKVSSDETQILEVSFTDAAKTKWIPFKISSREYLEDGFAYYVKDGNNKTFRIDYFADSDDVVITNVSTDDTWVLYRRND